MPVASGTLGLLVALRALTRRTGEHASQVVVPSFSFPATAQAVAWNGLEPVFADIDPANWHLCPRALEHALSARRGKVAAVVAVSALGTPPPASVHEAWRALAGEHAVPLVVDSAAGFGAMADDGRPIGAHGDVEVVSFHATKPLAAGEGGAVFAGDPDLARDIQRLANFGFDEHRQTVDDHGINGKLSEPSAATALAALDALPDALAARRSRAMRIVDALGDDLDTQHGHVHSNWQFVPVAARDGAHRRRILASAEGEVELRTYYEPLHRMSAFRAAVHADALTATVDIGERILSLPLAVDLTDAEIDRIVTAVGGNAGGYSGAGRKTVHP